MSVPVAPAPHPHPEPRSYTQMLRTWHYETWRAVVGLVLTPVGLLIIGPLLALPVLFVTVALDHQGSYGKAVQSAASLDHVTWQALLYLNLSLAAMVPVTWALMRMLHRMRPRWLMSVLPGIRWRFFLACLGLSVVAIVAQVVVGAFLPDDPNGLSDSLNDIDKTLVGLALVVLLTTPLQAMGEEYLFRGYLMQVVGALSRRPWVAIGVSGFLFACAHGLQNFPLFFDRFAFGVMAAYLVHRTGGLEAGIALHIWNNLVAFGFAIFLGNLDDTLKVEEIGWINLPLTITQNGVYLLLVLWVARRMRITAVTSPPVLPPAPAPV